MYKADKTTLEMVNFPIEGNLHDHAWPFIIIKENGKPDHLAISLLAHVVYWYRHCFDPVTKQVGKKYKGDLLQRSYSEIEDMLGLTKREAQEAFQRLEKLDVIHRVLRTIDINGQKISNVLFIQFNHLKLTEMRNEFFKKCIPSYAEKDEGVREKGQGDTPIVTTYTETTSEISPKNTTTTSDVDDFSFSDKESEDLNNFTAEQYQQAKDITNRDCIQKANRSRVKFFFKVLENLQSNPPKKPKLSVYDELCLHFKNLGLYNDAICYLNKDFITFERGMRNEPLSLKYFSWQKFQDLCDSFKIEFKRGN